MVSDFPSAKSLINRLADRLDQILLFGLYVWLCVRLLPNGLASHHWNTALLVLSEGVVVFFVLTRRPAEAITLDLGKWIVALGGTTAAMLVQAGGQPFLPDLALVLLTIGAVIHIAAKFSLRRSFGIVAANRGVKTGGLYRLVRHPMYLGYMLTHVGYFLSSPTIWNALVYIFVWSMFVIRIRDEEAILMQDGTYSTYGATVRWRLIPGVW